MSIHSLWCSARPILLLGLLAGCDATASAYCTDQFVNVTITVVDSTGAEVNDAVITSTLVRTGEVLTPAATLELFVPGTYVIVDDLARPKLLAGGDTVRVVALRGTAAAGTTATYLIDVPGGCHVNKLSGPDTLTVQ